MKYKISPAVTLKKYIEMCIEDPDDGKWMIHKEESYSLNMELFSVTLENWDIEPEEYAKIENEVLSGGFGNCLNSDQLEDIVQNLKDQKENYTNSELEKAINFYAEKDSFIFIENA